MIDADCFTEKEEASKPTRAKAIVIVGLVNLLGSCMFRFLMWYAAALGILAAIKTIPMDLNINGV